jgi:hypothetical protein
MRFHKIKLSLPYLLLLVLLTACGHSIPTASIDLIKQKKSILVLTSPKLDKSLQSKLSQTLNTWKQSELITYEWVQQIDVVDDLLINKINHTAYSYILVLGNDLTPTTITAAALTRDKRWIVLSDANHADSGTRTITDNVALYQLNAAVVATQWSEWVKQQQVQQQRSQGIYNSVDSITYQTINSPNVPAVDFQKSVTVILKWDTIMAEQLKVIQLNSYQKGIHYYSTEQMMINH